MDNVRIGSDALLYNLQFDIQVGNCLPPPINGSVSDYVKLEYYDGTSWSPLQNECLHSRCLLMVVAKVFFVSFERCFKKVIQNNKNKYNASI